MVPRKKFEVQPLTPETPIYPIGVAAKLLNVHPRTLRIYEDEGLIFPAHKGKRRMFSENDIKWVTCLRKLIHEQGVSIPGLKKLLNLAPCWEVADCPVEIHSQCNALVDKAAPKSLRLAGDEVAEAKAKEAEQKVKEVEGDPKKKIGRS